VNASITARVRVDDFDAWKLLFDQDIPNAREKALGWTLYRGTDDGFSPPASSSVSATTTARSSSSRPTTRLSSRT